MSVMFGKDADRIISTAFTETDHDLSYENVTFAERANAVVGMILAYTTAAHRRSSRDPLHRAAGKLRLRMRIVEVFLAPVMRVNDSIEDNDYYLQFIAVDQNTRVGGVGSVLLDEFERQARAAGSRRLSLDVSIGNDTAIEFYKNRGWSVDFEWPEVRLMPTLSLRMSKPLG